MTDPSPGIISKASPISIGVAVVMLSAMGYISMEVGGMKTRLNGLDEMKQDVREIRGILSRNSGIDIRQDAEIRSNRERLERLDAMALTQAANSKSLTLVHERMSQDDDRERVETKKIDKSEDVGIENARRITAIEARQK